MSQKCIRWPAKPRGVHVGQSWHCQTSSLSNTPEQQGEIAHMCGIVQAVNKWMSTTFPLIGFLKDCGNELLKLPRRLSTSINAGVDLGSSTSGFGDSAGVLAVGIYSKSFAKNRARYRRLKFLTFERRIEALTIRMNESVWLSGWERKMCGSWNHCRSSARTSIYHQRRVSASSEGRS